MSQDDPQQPDRAAPSWISRDTLLLLGALSFLILAITLTFVFSPGGEEEAAQATTTPAAGEPSGQPSAVAGGGYPIPSVGPGVEITPGTPGEDPAGGAPTSPPPGAYPEPTAGQGGPSSDAIAATASAFALGTVGPEGLGTPEAPLDDSTPATGQFGTPTFDPEAPTATLDTGEQPYPQPEGQPPAQPTFNPTRTQPTSPPPPTFAPPPPTNTPAVGSTAFQPPTVAPPTPTAEPFDATPAPPPPTQAPIEPTGAPLATSTPLAPAAPAAPAQPAADVLRGNVRWAAGQSPIVLRRDVQLAPGAELIIEPGVEVRLDPGVSIYVDGARLLALGTPDRPVSFVGNTGARWSGIYGLPGSFVAMEHTQIRGGGVGGTVLAIERGELVMRSSKVNDNGGSILLTDTKIEMLDSEVAGNDMPYGAALETSFSRGNFVVLRGNRIAGNILSEGAPMVRVASQSATDTLNLEITGNLFRGGAPNLQLSTNGPLKGAVDCNALVGDGLGLGLRTQTVQVGPNGTYTMDLRVQNNFIDEHVPPIIPVYLKYGLGRGAASEIMVDMRNNWWGDPSGPYEPDQNALGRGDSVGANITFAPWLEAPPACAPSH